MARIPTSEGFGEVVARPQRFNESQTPRGAFGADLAATVQGIGADMRRGELQAEAQAQATREAATKARAMAELQLAQEDLAGLSDELGEGIRTGQVEKDKAGEEWTTRANERVAATIERLPGEYRELAQMQLGGKVARFGRSVSKAVTQRDQQDVRSGIDQTLEYAGRLYLQDPKTADAMVTGVLDELGPFSGLNPADVQKVRQGWKESSRFTAASALVNGARRDNRALDEIGTRLTGDEFADMDPQRKTQLLTTLEGYKVSNVQRAEADARRREAEQERMLRRAESEFNAAQSIITQGKQLSPAYIEQVTKATAGTPYELAFRESLQAGPAAAAFGSQPLAVQAQALTQLRTQLNKQGTTPDVEKRVAELQKVHDAAVRDYKADPLPAALERGVIEELAPINTADLGSLTASIGQRVQQAQLVQQQVGQSVSPLTQQEAERVAAMIEVLPVKQRAEAVAQLGQAVGGPTAQALARQVFGKDKALGLAMAAGASRTTEGRFTSELILRGAQAIKDKAVKTDDAKGTGWRSEIVAEIGDAYANEEQREAVVEAAFLIRAGLESEGRGNNRQAVNLATGGIVERNGRKVPLPYGIKPDEFERKLRALTPQSLSSQTVVIGGRPVPVEQFIAGIPSAQLIQAGAGRYAVASGDGIATDDKGRPVIFEVR